MVMWYNVSHSWAYKERELNSRVSAVAKRENRELGEFFSLLYPASSFKRCDLSIDGKAGVLQDYIIYRTFYGLVG